MAPESAYVASDLLDCQAAVRHFRVGLVLELRRSRKQLLLFLGHQTAELTKLGGIEGLGGPGDEQGRQNHDPIHDFLFDWYGVTTRPRAFEMTSARHLVDGRYRHFRHIYLDQIKAIEAQFLAARQPAQDEEIEEKTVLGRNGSTITMTKRGITWRCAIRASAKDCGDEG
jgi:hypothetical protein